MTELEKIVDRIQKLLRLSNDGGATEAEAALAAEKAQEIMAEYNLSMAEIESKGESSGDDGKREQQTLKKRGMYKWQRSLMEVLGRTNYCIVMIGKEWDQTGNKGQGRMRNTFRVYGRAANVAAVSVTFDYLCQSMTRLMKEDTVSRSGNYVNSFKIGATEKLVERIDRRHREILDEQKRQAEARRAANPSGANALVLADWEQTEQDLNNDFRTGQAPGTTAARRAAHDQRYHDMIAKRVAEKARLIAEGISPEVAEYMSRGFDRERAEALANPKPKSAREQERERRRSERYWSRQARKGDRLNSEAYYSGRAAGDRIGLDPQVSKRSSQKLIG